MLKNYVKSAFRTLVKNKSYAAINILGLAVSLATTMLILLWVWDELSYDRMHSNGDRIYQLSSTFDLHSENLWPVGPPSLAPYAQQELPAVEAACRIANSEAMILTDSNPHPFDESGLLVDSSFFQIFDFSWIGSPRFPFRDSHSIVLTKTLARKYFGKRDAVGEIVQVNFGLNKAAGPQNFRVAGVIEDFPHNSSIQADFLLPLDLRNELLDEGTINEDWGSFSYRTFFLLRPGTKPHDLEIQLADLHRRNNEAEIFKTLVYFLQPLKDIHLYNGKGEARGMQQVRIFGLVAGIILVIACINYVNLVTALATRRGKEVSVRKVIGANRVQLFWQFISESVVVFLASLALALTLACLAMPLYNNLSGKEMVFRLLDSRLWLVIAGLFCVVVLLAGIYPALLLSTSMPAQGLKGMLPGTGRNSFFRKGLVVVQFSSAVVLIIATIIISRQLDYIRKKELGYDKENVFILPQLNFLDHFEAIRSELERQPGIRGVTASSDDISNIGRGTGDIDWEGKPAGMANFMVNLMSVDHRFLEIMDLELIQGHGFAGMPADSGYLILNETAVRQMGLADPVGKPVTFRYRPMTIAGVVKDFHFNDLKKVIAPCVLFVDRDPPQSVMYVKTAGTKAADAIAAVERLWKRHNTGYAFDYQFIDESFDELYKTDIRAGRLFNVFAGIAIFIACLGLLGLSMHMAELRTKEIGVRKVLGASAQSILGLLSKDFLKLELIAIVIAAPLGWYLMHNWLEDFAYRVTLKWWIFVVAGLLAVVIASLAVGFQSVKATLMNPLKSLRSD